MPKNMRHVVNVMRPPDPQGEDVKGNSPTAFREQVYCSIEPLSGRELERMQQMYAVATTKVGMYGNPNKQVKTTDWLIDQFGKRLNIGHIDDPLRNQQGYIELICSEEAA